MRNLIKKWLKRKKETLTNHRLSKRNFQINCKELTMPFIPHTPHDIKEMLETIGAQKIQDLFREVPKELAPADLTQLPEGLKELEIARLMQERLPSARPGTCFIGAGAYEHHIPAMIGDIISRGEFYTAYTPYQAEASQGTLQSLFEYQTMMCELTGMDVSNASVYDGANALAEAALMAVRIRKNIAKKIIVPANIHPAYRKVLKTILTPQDIQIIPLPYSKKGSIDIDFLKTVDVSEVAAIIIPQPNFFGALEDVDTLTDFAHNNGLLTIALVNPIAIALLKEPGSWGKNGADIVCGEGQALGIPLSYGGPYFGFICCKKEYLRQLPGRIVGRTHDANQRVGYTLTLQTREQHIRRAKATSNICTNQGLFVTAATIYLTIMGGTGLKQVAGACHEQASHFAQQLSAIPGVTLVFGQPFFHEFVIRLNQPVEKVLDSFTKQGIAAGYSLKKDYPELGECLLVCVTETKTAEDLIRYENLLRSCLIHSASGKNTCSLQYSK
jgi:glycine dehydrogenase subunit 1